MQIYEMIKTMSKGGRARKTHTFVFNFNNELAKGINYKERYRFFYSALYLWLRTKPLYLWLRTKPEFFISI